jgi:hypothetical protein
VGSQQNQVTALPLSLKNIALLPHWPLSQRLTVTHSASVTWTEQQLQMTRRPSKWRGVESA